MCEFLLLLSLLFQIVYCFW